MDSRNTCLFYLIDLCQHFLTPEQQSVPYRGDDNDDDNNDYVTKMKPTTPTQCPTLFFKDGKDYFMCRTV